MRVLNVFRRKSKKSNIRNASILEDIKLVKVTEIDQTQQIETIPLDFHYESVQDAQGGLMGEVKLSEAELAELKDIFRMFDKDNSGSIDVNELESMVSSLGISATKEDLNDMIAEADIDKSGTIEFDEFKTLIGPHFQKEKPPEDYIDAFNFFDKDGDGFISRSELRNIMNTVDSKLAESDIEDMIKEADINGDGKIDFDEFIKMMHQQ
ncbi:hypothetical protein ACHWQZ_G019593 [Mnemiopsis leidyi]